MATQPKPFAEHMEQVLQLLGQRLHEMMQQTNMSCEQIAEQIAPLLTHTLSPQWVEDIVIGNFPSVTLEEICAIEHVIKRDLVIIPKTHGTRVHQGKLTEFDPTDPEQLAELESRMQDNDKEGGILMTDHNAQVVVKGKPFMQVDRLPGEGNDDFAQRIVGLVQDKIASEGLPEGVDCQCPNCTKARERSERNAPIIEEMGKIRKKHGAQVIFGKPTTD